MRRHRYEAAFESFGRALDRYWLASLASADFAPDIMTLTFPDGDTESFDGQMDLPAVTHRA